RLAVADTRIDRRLCVASDSRSSRGDAPVNVPNGVSCRASDGPISSPAGKDPNRGVPRHPPSSPARKAPLMSKAATLTTDVLKETRIDESGPGTILRDFQTILDFVGTGGLQTGGKNHRLPLASLANLDERLSHPLRPALSRPQQLSYPHINGLY